MPSRQATVKVQIKLILHKLVWCGYWEPHHSDIYAKCRTTRCLSPSVKTPGMFPFPDAVAAIFTLNQVIQSVAEATGHLNDLRDPID